MKIANAITLAKKSFEAAGITSASLDAMVLLCHAISFTKEKIIFNPDLELTSEQEKNFLTAIARRQSREPVSHIIGNREFYGLDFFVNASVLDPRPDSETLIETVFEKFANKNQTLKILELGVGSGCLIITLLKYFPNSSAIGADISLQALEICQKNAISNKVAPRLLLKESNLFSAITQEKFDLIISNPPYIAKKEIENLQDEVRLHEPILALDGGVDGLDFYREIAKNSANFLKPQALVVLEIGYGQESDVKKIFSENRFLFDSQKLDFAGVVRVLCFRLS